MPRVLLGSSPVTPLTLTRCCSSGPSVQTACDQKGETSPRAISLYSASPTARSARVLTACPARGRGSGIPRDNLDSTGEPASFFELTLARAEAAIGHTFPPVAVLALTIPVLGYGAAALCLYAIFPVIEATVTGLRAVPAAVRDPYGGSSCRSRFLSPVFAMRSSSISERRRSDRPPAPYRWVRPSSSHRRAARHGGGSLFRLARGFRAPRRNASEVDQAGLSGHRAKSGYEAVAGAH
jgi:hypothetical protein